jgi:predicted phage tail protein
MAQPVVTKEERSLGDLFSELATETSTLVRQEVALAQVELTQKATKVGKNVGFLVVGGAVGYAALLAILAAVIIGLSYFIPAWAAALIVGVAVGIVSYLLVSSALAALKKTDLTPRETVETLKEDAQWLKNQVS